MQALIDELKRLQRSAERLEFFANKVKRHTMTALQLSGLTPCGKCDTIGLLCVDGRCSDCCGVSEHWELIDVEPLKRGKHKQG